MLCNRTYRTIDFWQSQSLIETRAEDLTPQILQMQQNYANTWYELQQQSVDLENVKHAAILESIYENSGLDTEKYDARKYDYLKLGFAQNPPDIVNDFLNAGLLGLHTLHHIATTASETFATVSMVCPVHEMTFCIEHMFWRQMVLEQVNRPDEKRCPIALVSLQATRILSEQFDLSGSLASTSFQVSATINFGPCDPGLIPSVAAFPSGLLSRPYRAHGVLYPHVL